MEDLFKQAELLKNTLISYATKDVLETGDYAQLRKTFLKNPTTAKLVPEYIKKCRDLSEFWSYIQPSFPKYQERRTHIRESLSELLDYLEQHDFMPSEQLISTTLAKFDPTHIREYWEKTIERRENDPEGAITSARSLIETVCKHILDELSVTYSDKIDLPELYKLTAKQLNLAPENHQEEIFKQILGGCASVVSGMGALRNKISDAHGKNKQYVKPSSRHASLVINLSGSMALFLIETHLAKASKP
jgi:hypothetical protein